MDTTHTNRRCPVDAGTASALTRAVRGWCAEASKGRERWSVDYIPEDSGSAIVPSEIPYVSRRYIYGGHIAHWEGDLVRRVMPTTDDERMQADEDLDAFAAKVSGGKRGTILPTADDMTATVKSFTVTTRSILRARYTNGAEDHATHITMDVEILPKNMKF